jgi:hypothetical protein
MTEKIRRGTLKYCGAVLLIVGFISVIPMNATAQGSLTLNINRNVGIALGSLIQGTFTLSGSGPEDVQNLTVYFNGEEVHFVTGNTISWQFNTGDYPGGATNITLRGVDSVGTMYTASRQMTFIGGIVGTLLPVVIIGFVVVLIIAKYGSRIANMRKK